MLSTLLNRTVFTWGLLLLERLYKFAFTIITFCSNLQVPLGGVWSLHSRDHYLLRLQYTYILIV